MPHHRRVKGGDDPDHDGKLVVRNAVKRALDFSALVREDPKSKEMMETAVVGLAKRVRNLLDETNDHKSDHMDVANVLWQLSQMQINVQRTPLPTQLGMARAREIFQIVVGDPAMFDPNFEYIHHDEKPAIVGVEDSGVHHDEKPAVVGVEDGLGSPAHTAPSLDAQSVFHKKRATPTDADEHVSEDEPTIGPMASHASSQMFGPVHLLEFARSPKEFFNALRDGPELQACRNALEVERFSPVVSGGAFVFVHPEQFTAVMHEVRARTLKPRHVIIAAEFECRLNEALENIGRGVVEKDRKLLPPPPAIVKRTFLEVQIKSSLRSEPPTDVVASTADANPRVKYRPRRA